MLDFYGKFAKRNEGHAELARETAVAYRRVGDIQQRLGHYDEAEEAYRHAIQLWSSDGMAHEPLEHALAENQLGQLLLRSARFEEARECHEEALAVLEHDPDPAPSIELERARAHNGLGLATQLDRGPGGAAGPGGGQRGPGGGQRGPGGRPGGPGRGQRGPGGRPDGRPDRLRNGRETTHDLARREFETALGILNGLLDDSPPPGDPELRLAAARTQRLIADVARPLPGESPPEMSIATQMLTDLVDEFPESARFRFELAETLLTVPGPRERRPRIDETRQAQLERARGILDELTAEHPEEPLYRAGQAKALRALGRSAQRRGQVEEAESLLGQSYAITQTLVLEQPDVPRYGHEWGRTTLALHELLARAGRFEECVDLVRPCIDELRHSPDDPETSRVLSDLWVALGQDLRQLGDDSGFDDAMAEARRLRGRRRGDGPGERGRPGRRRR